MTGKRSLPDRKEFEQVLRLVIDESRKYIDTVDEKPARFPGADAAAEKFQMPFPKSGLGAAATIRKLIDEGMDACVTSSGPRNFHFVIGGTTPAALGAEWLASAMDQIAYAWVTSPLAVTLENVSLAWLGEAFGLPRSCGGIMTTGATMANFVCLAAARQWWGDHFGLDVAENGLGSAPPVPVLSSGYIHAASIKCLSMLGIGRSAVQKFQKDDIGRLDIKALRTALQQLDGAPAIIIGNAGEVNAGDFDPIAEMADLAEEFNSWLHVDGAFGLFAQVSRRTRDLTAGIDRAHSIAVDGHKWLNVPYDCGFSFMQDPSILPTVFHYMADYLPKPDDPRPNMGVLGPESSRRARSFSVWATLAAYGRDGLTNLVEHHLDLAQLLAKRVDESPDLERLADVPLNIVCFRYHPGDRGEAELNRINTELGQALIEDGRVYAGTTQYGSKTALRPAIVNWRMRREDIDYLVDVVREIGAGIVAGS